MPISNRQQDERITLRISKPMALQLVAVARANECSMSAFIRLTLKRALAKHSVPSDERAEMYRLLGRLAEQLDAAADECEALRTVAP